MLFSTENDPDIGDGIFGNKEGEHSDHYNMYGYYLDDGFYASPVVRKLAVQQVENLSPKNKMGIYISSIKELKKIYGDSLVESKYQQLIQRVQNTQLPKINCTYLYLVSLLKKENK